jgi:hypothetical protein
MDAELKGHGAGRPEVSEAKTSDTTNKSSRQRKQQQWESHREEIHELYMVDNKTLKSTMQIIKNKYNFTPRSAPLAIFLLYFGIFGRRVPNSFVDAETLTYIWSVNVNSKNN